jgi:hypothetical protein
MSIEISSGTVITASGDDLIEISGELKEEFNAYECINGTMALSDGTLLRVTYDEDGIWRFKPIYKGDLFENIIVGSINKDTNDEIYFKNGLKWCAFSKKMQVEVNRNIKLM